MSQTDDIAWAGFQEFARQWLLVSRRAPYEPSSGQHRLWLNIGGSAGHSSLWGVDIAEGQIPNRGWNVDLLKSSEVRVQSSERKAASKQQAQQDKLHVDMRAVVNAMTAIGSPETQTTIAAHAGISGSRMSRTISQLLQDGHIETVEITKGNNRHYSGYRTVESGGFG